MFGKYPILSMYPFLSTFVPDLVTEPVDIGKYPILSMYPFLSTFVPDIVTEPLDILLITKASPKSLNLPARENSYARFCSSPNDVLGLVLCVDASALPHRTLETHWLLARLRRHKLSVDDCFCTLHAVQYLYETYKIVAVDDT